MQKIVSFKIAQILNDIGYKEQTDFLYCITYPGIRAVLSNDAGDKKVVKEFKEGALEKIDPELGVVYPSTHWIPAPYVFDVIKWFDEKYGIRYIPIFDKEFNYYEYTLIIPDYYKYNSGLDDEQFLKSKTNSLELSMEDAIEILCPFIQRGELKL